MTEENVDLNRNFVDHDQPHPKNPEYTKLHPVILPEDWEEKTVAASKEKLERYATKHSLYKLQSILTGGQYAHPDGIFFGGTEPTGTQLRFRQIVAAASGAFAAWYASMDAARIRVVAACAWGCWEVEREGMRAISLCACLGLGM